MLVVVSDTSPLRCLFHVGQLSLLERMFASVVIPPAVLEELRESRRGDISEAVLGVKCVREQPALNTDQVAELSHTLDPGEAEAISVAIEIGADLILMDEKRGRAECARRRLETMGVLGLLARAKLRGLVPEVRSLVEELRRGGGFYISDALRKRILLECGELDE